MRTDAAKLLARIEDALALYDEPAWREIQLILTDEKPPSPPAERPMEWYKAEPQRLAKERAVLTRLLSACPDCPNLFFQRERTQQLGAVGLAALTGGTKVKVEIAFPDDYPTTPARVYFFGPALTTI
ncbi:MAG: hypothetical protein WCI73_04000, partial [Phycisphaerae bacterium]